MKGVIVQCLQELVSVKFGIDKWEKSLVDAGVPANSKFIVISDVPDDVVMNVVQSVCKNLNITLEQAATAFGDYWVNVYSQKLYSNMYKFKKNAKDFLLYMDEIHINMTKTMKNAHPPRFEYELIGDNTLIMKYKSKRGLIDFLIGLIKGVGTYYNEKLDVRKLSDDKVQIDFK